MKFILSHRYVFKYNTCSFKRYDNHILRSYPQRRLSGSKNRQFIERIKSDQYTTCKKMTTNISSRASEIVGAVRAVDPILLNKNRVRYELNVAKNTLGL